MQIFLLMRTVQRLNFFPDQLIYRYNRLPLHCTARHSTNVLEVTFQDSKCEVMYGMSKKKIFADSVHSMISISGLLLDIIDTPEMQRLRRISQLSTVNLVYPAATHDRFCHSLGVCHLAGRMIDVLEYKDTKEKEKDKLCVQIAGLCHDLGHGPWSHVYDKVFLKGLLGDEWEHEEMSCEILKKIRDRVGKEKFEDYGIDDECFENIQVMIKGKKKEFLEEKQWKKAYLYQIVANKDYEIDVDKWDYFKRDAQACGMSETFDFERAFHTVRICETENGKYRELCYRKQDALNMFYLFNKRFFLFKKVYHHQVSYGAEIMLAEAMAKDPSIKTAKDNVDEFLELDDISCKTKLQNNEEAKAILKKMDCRKFYKCIFDEQCPSDNVNAIKKEMQDLLLNDKFKDLKDDITIQHVKFKLDELKAMPFYTKEELSEGKPLKLKEASQMLPEQFQECYIRIYRKCDEKEKINQFKKECHRIIKESRN